MAGYGNEWIDVYVLSRRLLSPSRSSASRSSVDKTMEEALAVLICALMILKLGPTVGRT